MATNTSNASPIASSSNVPPKILLKKAETSFLKRDYPSALEYIKRTLTQLASPRSLTWAIELSPKERTVERQRARAVSLLVTASALRWNETKPKGITSSDENTETMTLDTAPSDASSFLKNLNDQILASYAPSSSSSSSSSIEATIPIPPPSVIETLSLAGLSIDAPLPFIRSLIEPYLGRLDDPVVLTALAQSNHAQPSDEAWWTTEANQGYQSLIQLYLLSILAPDGIGGRAEASRLLEWDDRLSPFAKDIIRSKLNVPTPPSPSIYPSPSPSPSPPSPSIDLPPSDGEADEYSDLPPLSVESSVMDGKSPVYHPSAMTSLLPSPLASPSPSHASLSSQPPRSASPRPPGANRKRPSWLLVLSALPPTAILFLALWSLRRKPSLGPLGRRRIVDLLARLAAVLWRDLVATVRFATALTYV